MQRRLFSRRRFLSATGVGALGIAGGGAYMRFIESGWLAVGRHEVPLSTAAAGSPLRLLHLSDLHASKSVSLEFIERAIEMGLRLKPDLICLTGDFVTRRFNAMERYASILKRLATAAPTFASLGNHDGGAWAGPRGGYESTQAVRALLAASGISLLHNTARTLTLTGRSLRLVGVGDSWADELDARQAFAAAPVPEQTPTILLSHNPDTKEDVESFAWNLMLCGHTHGGQVCLPLIGTPFAPVRDRRFVKGLNPWKDRWIHTTKGVGNLYGVRFNCRPEVSLLTLR
jgi:predicted MPP superfamily phosphohydrolase